MISTAPLQPGSIPAGSNHVLILCFSLLHRDPRMLRQIEALREDCGIIAAGFSDPEIPGVTYVSLNPPPTPRPLKQWVILCIRHLYWRLFAHLWKITRAYRIFYWSQPHIRRAHKMLAETADTCQVILANDIATLPLALRLAERNGARVVYDAHEYAPHQFGHIPQWRLFQQGYRTWLCKKMMPQADVCITVGQSIADLYRKETGVSCRVAMNLAAYHPLTPRPTPAQPVRLIHHGGAYRTRNLELMLDVAMRLDARFETTFVLVPGDPAYIRGLKERARDCSRIRFAEPVAFHQIVPMLHDYDIGLCLLEPVNLQLRHALPNKFFEFIQARLMVATGPGTDMAELTERHGCGLVTEDYSPAGIARRLNDLTTDAIDRYKQGSHRAARELNGSAAADIWRQCVLQNAATGS